MDQPKYYIRSGYNAQWDIETPKAFIGENILRVDVMDGKLYIGQQVAIELELMANKYWQSVALVIADKEVRI